MLLDHDSDWDSDWKSIKARNYFSMTWNGPTGNGLVTGEENLENLYFSIENTFHDNYQFVRPDGRFIGEGVDELKKVLTKLTVPLVNLKMTSFDIVALTENAVTFQSTATADKKENGERYVQCLRLTYVFQDQKVSRAIVHYHSNYEDK